jgi:transcription antitermination factor NusG
MPDIERQWLVVYTKPRWEKKVDGLFAARGIESYCPLNRVRKKWSDRVKWVEEPLFKSYVLVHVAQEELTTVRMVNGVVNFVYWLGRPAVVRPAEIDIIRKFLAEYDEVIAEPLELKTSDHVTIQQGVFMDQEAKVMRVMKKKVQVIIESIGYSLTVVIDRSNIAVRSRQGGITGRIGNHHK